MVFFSFFICFVDFSHKLSREGVLFVIHSNEMLCAVRCACSLRIYFHFKLFSIQICFASITNRSKQTRNLIEFVLLVSTLRSSREMSLFRSGKWFSLLYQQKRDEIISFGHDFCLPYLTWWIACYEAKRKGYDYLSQSKRRSSTFFSKEYANSCLV